MRKIAILQSDYIPWKGVFDMINMVDGFVFLEDVDFTYRDWRSRNRIVTPNGAIWLSVPVNRAERGTKIKDITICSDSDWQNKHFLTLCGNYKKAPYFEDYYPLLEEIYLEQKWHKLSELNIFATKRIAQILGIKTVFYNSVDVPSNGKKDDKLIEICQSLGATHYLSGPAAKDYIHNEKFKEAGIELSYIRYDGYPVYKQLFGQFNHYVSVLDVLFNCGDDAPEYIFIGREERVSQ